MVKEGVSVGIQRASLLGKNASEKFKETAKEDRKVRLVCVILGASLVHLIKATKYVGDGVHTTYERGQTVVAADVVVDYMMTVGPISLSFCCVYLLIATMMPEALEKQCKLLTYNQLFGVFMLIWWVCGAAVGTIDAPFEGIVGLGYFASWTACVASIMLFNAVFMGLPFEKMAAWGSNAGQPWESKLFLLCLFFSSALVFIECLRLVFWSKRTVVDVASGDFRNEESFTVLNQPTGYGSAIYGVVISAYTMKDTLLLNLMTEGDWSRGISAAIMFGLWVIGVFVLTISQPFETADNGYFGVWFSTFCAAGLVVQEFQTVIPSSRRFAPASLFTAASLVVFVESMQYAGHEGTFKWNGDDASAALGDYAMVSGMLSFMVGGVVMVGVLSLEYSKFSIAYSPHGTCHCQPVVSAIFSQPRALLGVSFTLMQALAAFLLAWWVCAACILTYGFPPYKDLGNGYIATWVCVVAAAVLLPNDPPPTAPPTAFVPPPLEEGEEAAERVDVDPEAPSHEVPLPPADEPPPKRLTAGFFALALSVASLLLLMAAIERTADNESAGLTLQQAQPATGEKAFAVVVPLLTGFFLLCRLALFHAAVVGKLAPKAGGDARYKKLVQYAFTIFLTPATWVCAAIVLTFDAPFADPGNGFFSTWIGLFAAGGLAFEEYKSEP